MRQLPDKFQMRVSAMPHFTNTVKRNAYGDYEVTWARGYPEALGKIPVKVFLAEQMEWIVGEGYWVVVEDKPKQEETKLSDEWVSPKPPAQIPSQFYFAHKEGDCSGSVSLRKDGKGWDVLWDGEKKAEYYSYNWVPAFINNGSWKILDKKPLTAEQQRSLKEFREQVQQLTNSIKIQEQDVEHKRRLISNYVQRQQELVAKIKELESA